jgi:DNA-binding transcriptional LysR family regulator
MNGPERLPKLQLIQSFFRVADHGSLAATVKAIGGSPATLSRHIAALEAELGVTLFERRGDGLALTETGLALYAHAAEVTEAAHRFVSAAAGHDQTLSGSVRISASKGVAGFLLPPILAELALEETEIDIELVPSDSQANLLLREADIAVRMFRPKETNLIARKLGDINFGLFAAKAYLHRRGTPASVADLADHDLIGDDGNTQVLQGLQYLGLKMDRDGLRFRCDDRYAAWELLRTGCGIGVAHLSQGLADPRLARVLPDTAVFAMPVWLTSHSELKTSARVRRVFNFLADRIGAALSAQRS